MDVVRPRFHQGDEGGIFGDKTDSSTLIKETKFVWWWSLRLQSLSFLKHLAGVTSQTNNQTLYLFLHVVESVFRQDSSSSNCLVSYLFPDYFSALYSDWKVNLNLPVPYEPPRRKASINDALKNSRMKNRCDEPRKSTYTGNLARRAVQEQQKSKTDLIGRKKVAHEVGRDYKVTSSWEVWMVGWRIFF